ncbi:membrane integrity-associated transporter subunit PqiC [candidate division KSB1 bacterium]|nr:membrane integrity-associated transporter subunit PqiC [candidate division KSB1 bacterium]
MQQKFYKHSIHYWVLSCVFLLLESCGGTQSVQYFTLDMPSLNSNNKPGKTADYLSIKQFDSGIMYHEDRLIFQGSPREVKHWNYKKWISPPSILLTEAIKRHFTNANIFKGVLDYPAAIPTRYILEGKINAFEEYDVNENWTVRVGFELRMLDVADQRYIWEGAYENQIPVKEKTANAVVKSIDEAVFAIIQQVLVELNPLFNGK